MIMGRMAIGGLGVRDSIGYGQAFTLWRWGIQANVFILKVDG